jgi:hypothetical protein
MCILANCKLYLSTLRTKLLCSDMSCQRGMWLIPFVSASSQFEICLRPTGLFNETIALVFLPDCTSPINRLDLSFPIDRALLVRSSLSLHFAAASDLMLDAP